MNEVEPINQVNPWINWTLEPIDPLNQLNSWTNSILEPIGAFEALEHMNHQPILTLAPFDPLTITRMYTKFQISIMSGCSNKLFNPHSSWCMGGWVGGQTEIDHPEIVYQISIVYHAWVWSNKLSRSGGWVGVGGWIT